MTATAILAGAALLWGGHALAGARVTRCVGGDGSTVYTDGSCRAIGAQVAPMSAELLRNLIRDGADASAEANAPMPAQPAIPAAARPDADESCARTPSQLAATLRASLNGGDVNQLAGVYDWAGMTGRQAKPVMQRLEHMSDRPLLDGHYYDASGGNTQNNAGVVQLVQGAVAAPSVTELVVSRRAGCLFLHF